MEQQRQLQRAVLTQRLADLEARQAELAVNLLILSPTLSASTVTRAE